MKKSIFAAAMGALLPLSFLTGCAHPTDQSSAAFSPLPATAMAPTSNRSEPRVYGNEASDSAAYPLPNGANAQDWALGQRIREMLSTNMDLSASPVAVVVHGSTVILQGSVPTQREKRKVKAAIAAVPGVQQVQDEMQIKNPAGHFNEGESKSY